MRATVPWSLIALWRHKRQAMVIGFAPSVAALIVQSGAILATPLVGALATVSGWFILGWALSVILAAQKWTIPRWVSVAVVILAGLFSVSVLPSRRSAPNIGTTVTGNSNTVRLPDTTPKLPPTTSHGGSSRPPRSDVATLRRFSKQMVDGVVGFDYPQKLRVGDRTDVSLRVSAQKAEQELRDSLTREGRDPIVESVKLSSRMKAELHGFGFELTPLSSVEQLLDADEDTTWRWDVRATEAGKQRLTVTLTAIIDMEGSEGARDVSTFYREVEVEALPKTWWESTRNIAKEYGPSRDILWPAIGTGIAAVWAVLFTRRKARQKRGRRK